MRRLTLVIVVALGLVATSGCYGVSETASDPGYPLRHDWGPDPVIEYGVANSCFFVQSDVNGVSDICRVVDGDEEIGDHRNWDIKVSCTPVVIDIFGSTFCQPDASEIRQYGSPWDTYGEVVVTGGGEIYEGCKEYPLDHTTKNFWCDYRTRKVTPLTYGGVQGGWGWSYVYHELWPGYADYLIGDVLGCATFIAAQFYGYHITLPGLWQCRYGPK